MNPAPSVPPAGDNHDVSAPTAGRSQRGKKTTGTIAKRACDQCKFRKIKVFYGYGDVGLLIGVLTGVVQPVATMSRMSVYGLRMYLLPTAEETRSNRTVSEALLVVVCALKLS